MTLDIRSTDDPNRLDLYEGQERIGQITCELPDKNDPTDTDPPLWAAEVWSGMGTGKTWSADSESGDEIQQHARELYEEFVAERRELSKGSRVRIVGSVPMGGKPGWRRR